MRGTRVRWVLGAIASAVALPPAAWDPPSPSSSRGAFRAQFPKSPATSGALELEGLAAAIGLDLAPMDPPEPEEEESEEEVPRGAEPRRPPPRPTRTPAPDDGRSRPSKESAAAFQAISGDVSQFVDRELKSTAERIGPPPRRMERFFAEHADAMASIESLLTRDAEVAWEIDVTRYPYRGPPVNLPGVMRLQRLLVGKSLLHARRGETDGALQALEAGWRLNERLASRPELISQLIVVAAAKLHAGALRKVEAPGFGWSDRLRDGKLLRAFLAAFQNEAWFSTDHPEMAGFAEMYARVLRQIATGFMERDLCEWTTDRLEELWRRAQREQSVGEAHEEILMNIAVPNLLGAFIRWRRFLVDAELTALVLDARAERAASRERYWPAKLPTIGSGVCDRERWTYRLSTTGTATFSFEGRLVEGPSVGFRLPLTFTAGIPVTPTKRPTPSPPRRTPTVSAPLEEARLPGSR